LRLGLRPATAADVPFLLALRVQTMTPHQLGSGLLVTEREQEERVRYRFDCAQVVEVDEQAAGILKVTRDGLDWHVVQIQLLPALQSRGIGRRLLESVIREARAAGASLRLQVLRANRARGLYERLGFVVAGEGEHEYSMLLRNSPGPG
jgi:ribosomal protein S18 acetylase RimI-like enzyme